MYTRSRDGLERILKLRKIRRKDTGPGSGSDPSARASDLYFRSIVVNNFGGDFHDDAYHPMER